MDKLFFTLQEFNISRQPIPEKVADKILKHHLWPLNRVRHLYRQPIIISKRSGYRSFEHEIAHGRKGDSEHCFKGKGACDIVGSDMKLLLHLIATETDYCRICYYPQQNFFHLDFKNNVRRYFIDYSDGLGWQGVKNLGELSLKVK